MKKALIYSFAALSTVVVANAAPVTFSFEELAQDGSNVATEGVLHTSVAFLADGESRLVNGVEFNRNVAGRQDISFTDFVSDRNLGSTYYGTAGDDGIKDLTDDIVFATDFTVGINELVIGLEYRIQFISFDSGVAGLAGFVDRTSSITATGANTGSLNYNQTFINDGSSVQDIRGVLVTGTWIADTTEIDFDLSAIGDNNSAILNGFVVQAVPEPSSTALLGLGGLALILRRRK